jgi:hypothetical protein
MFGSGIWDEKMFGSGIWDEKMFGSRSRMRKCSEPDPGSWIKHPGSALDEH